MVNAHGRRVPTEAPSDTLGASRVGGHHPMPSSSPRLCPGCRQIVRGKCPTCTPAQRATTDQRRESPTARGYGSHWRRVIRPAFLRAHPLCVLCGALAEVPDHWPETRASLVARGVTDPDAEHRMRPLCLTCHARHGLSFKPWLKRDRGSGTDQPPVSRPVEG